MERKEKERTAVLVSYHNVVGGGGGWSAVSEQNA